MGENGPKGGVPEYVDGVRGEGGTPEEQGAAYELYGGAVG